MTWYASEIFILPNEGVIEHLQKNETLSEFSYLLPSSVEYRLNDQDYSLNFGNKGLLVVRPVCDPESHCASWHGGECVSWYNFSAKQKVISPIDLCLRNPEIDVEVLPPINFLAYLKQLSSTYLTDIVYFHSFMWGGETEIEYAWFFGRREEAMILIEPGVKSTVSVLDAGQVASIRQIDMLSESINYLGGRMIYPFCVIHTRNFPWSNYPLRLA